MDTRLAIATRQADARWTLLQALVDDKRCPYPGEYLEDCGECAVCAFRYKSGAEKFLVEYEDEIVVPGSAGMRKLTEKLRKDLFYALPRNASIRELSQRRKDNLERG